MEEREIKCICERILSRESECRSESPHTSTVLGSICIEYKFVGICYLIVSDISVYVNTDLLKVDVLG